MARIKAAMRREQKEQTKRFNPVKTDSRICFGISYFATQEEAAEYADEVRRRGTTYNGGYFHGMPCGRSGQFDHKDRETGRMLYAVTD